MRPLAGTMNDSQTTKEQLIEKLESLLTEIDVTDVIWVTGLDGQLSFDGKEELIGRHISSIISEESLVKFGSEVEQLVSRGNLSIETTCMTKDGGKVVGELSVNATYDSDGQYTGSRGVFRDVTERKQLEDQLIQAQKMEAVGTLAGGIAHDMNNVLAVVLGLSSVIEQEAGLGDAMTDDIRAIKSAAERGKSVVEKLLGFVRKGTYQRENILLNETVGEVVEMLRRTLPKTLSIKTELDRQLAAVECDPAQIMQTLLNLCLNANDALDGSGNITISTKDDVLHRATVGQLKPGPYVKLQVKDDGPGMTDETRRRAFEPFFTTKDVGKGTGLGLSMAYGVIQNHGGTLTIDSVVGEGTTISILLPAAKRAKANETDEV